MSIPSVSMELLGVLSGIISSILAIIAAMCVLALITAMGIIDKKRPTKKKE